MFTFEISWAHISVIGFFTFSHLHIWMFEDYPFFLSLFHPSISTASMVSLDGWIKGELGWLNQRWTWIEEPEANEAQGINLSQNFGHDGSLRSMDQVAIVSELPSKITLDLGHLNQSCCPCSNIHPDWSLTIDLTPPETFQHLRPPTWSHHPSSPSILWLI